MVEPLVVAGGVAALAIASAAGYSYLTGESSQASADVDGDGEDDLSVEFGDEREDGLPHAAEVDGETKTPSGEVAEAPQDVRDRGSDLAAVTGIGPTRADDLEKAGFHTAADLYFASDEELTAVSGIGPYTVEQVRSDIGGVESAE